MNDLKVFAYGEQQVRTVFIDEEPWWVLADVCKVLDITNSRNVAARLDEDELMSIRCTSGGQNRKLNVVNESGLYSVILRSDKPEAKAFKRWITHEVLPSIRRTGAYAVPVAVPVESEPQTKTTAFGPPPHYLPLSLPRLPSEAQLQRADRLIKMAEHPALTKEEQRYLLDLAAYDLTGGSLSPAPSSSGYQSETYAGPVHPTLSKRQEQELMALPEFICKVQNAGMKRCGSTTVQLYTLVEVAEMAGVAPADFDRFADKRRLKTSFNGEWVRVNTPTGEGREFLYMEDVVRMFQEEGK